MSYSKAVQQNNVEKYNPANNLAIVLDCPAGISVEECCESLADIISGRNMIYSSRLGGGRICVYLRNMESVTKIVNEQGILVKGVFVPVRKFMTEAIKIVLSNVCPTITNERITFEMAKFGRVASTVRQISNGFKRPDIAHMLSFRRVMYMIIDKPENLPESIIIEQEAIKYQIYISRDEVTCFKCKGTGHIARNCKKINTNQDKPLISHGPRTMADAVANRVNTDSITKTNATAHTENQNTSENTEVTILKLPPTRVNNNPTAVVDPIDEVDQQLDSAIENTQETVDLTTQASQDDVLTPGQDYHPTQYLSSSPTTSSMEGLITLSPPPLDRVPPVPMKENKRKLSDSEDTERNLSKRPSEQEFSIDSDINSDNESRVSEESYDSAASGNSKYNRTIDQKKALIEKSSLSIDKLLPFIKDKGDYPLKQIGRAHV